MVKVTFPDGTQAEMEDVEIVGETSPWSTFKLEDGTELKIRFNINKVQRAKDKFNQVGEPLYFISQSPMTIRARVPKKLKAQNVEKLPSGISEVG